MGFYFLPEEILGLKLKKADMLSEIRKEEPQDPILNAFEGSPDDPCLESPIKSTEDSVAKTESGERKSRDTLELTEATDELFPKDTLNADNRVLIQDFSENLDALQHTFEALLSQSPLRIAVLGDSFIEGDIFTYDLRQMLQKKFGGVGVGWMPITSKVAKYRKGIDHDFKHWKTKDVNNNKSGGYYLGETYFVPDGDEATVSYTLEPGSEGITHANLFYRSNDTVKYSYRIKEEEFIDILPPSSQMAETKIPMHSGKLSLCFYDAAGLSLHGVVFEEKTSSGGGVWVDNFSLRGASGVTLRGLDTSIASRMNQLRPHQLIILQYGINIMESGRLNYTAYTEKMVNVVQFLKKIFPESDILILGVSDRAVSSSQGKRETMREIYPLRKAILDVAKKTGVAYWDTFEAMNLYGGMVQFVADGMAAKDYTHMNFNGGRYLATKFFESFCLKYDDYRAVREQ